MWPCTSVSVYVSITWVWVDMSTHVMLWKLSCEYAWVKMYKIVCLCSWVGAHMWECMCEFCVCENTYEYICECSLCCVLCACDQVSVSVCMQVWQHVCWLSMWVRMSLCVWTCVLPLYTVWYFLYVCLKSHIRGGGSKGKENSLGLVTQGSGTANLRKYFKIDLLVFVMETSCYTVAEAF
jgi:hypothetical protein